MLFLYLYEFFVCTYAVLTFVPFPTPAVRWTDGCPHRVLEARAATRVTRNTQHETTRTTNALRTDETIVFLQSIMKGETTPTPKSKAKPKPTPEPKMRYTVQQFTAVLKFRGGGSPQRVEIAGLPHATACHEGRLPFTPYHNKPPHTAPHHTRCIR